MTKDKVDQGGVCVCVYVQEWARLAGFWGRGQCGSWSECRQSCSQENTGVEFSDKSQGRPGWERVGFIS